MIRIKSEHFESIIKSHKHNLPLFIFNMYISAHFDPFLDYLHIFT